MSYLNFDKGLLINLERSLKKEMLRTNRAGAYNSTTLIDCNTRKYHGQLVLPLPQLGEDNYVLLSSLDETVIQHGAEFNLGIHEYQGGHFSPNGHKYIREFSCDVISKTIYRVGGVILQKERMLVSFEPRVMIRYTLLEAHSDTTLRFRPFLAFRSTNELTRANDRASRDYQVCENGVSVQMYPEYPALYMQFSKKVEYKHNPDWYKDICYYKEKERGLPYAEDQYVPGYFELPMKKGESVIFSAGISEATPRALKPTWNMEMDRRNARTDMYHTLLNSAGQFYKRVGSKCYLLAGYPWFHAEARNEFMALPGCTLSIDRMEYWDMIMDTAVREIRQFLGGEEANYGLKGLDEPDALLWFVLAVQRYADHTSLHEAAQKYGQLVEDVLRFYKDNLHPRAHVGANGLIAVDGTERPATWMNAQENGRPITPRTGFVVEINALWYNDLQFCVSLQQELKKKKEAERMDYQASVVGSSFVDIFWNGYYLDDYVDGYYHNNEVRPNQIFAVGLPYSPLDRKQQKAVLDICTKELFTLKGLRTLSPKSGAYRGNYTGGLVERDRNYHNGPVWPQTLDAYVEAYMKIYRMAGTSFIERLLIGFEAEMPKLCIGTLNELYDGNPPYAGHGGMSYATSVAAVLRIIKLYNQLEEQEKEGGKL